MAKCVNRCRKAFLAIFLAAAVAFAPASAQEVFMPNQLDAVPSVLIIGTAKGGTTDLYKQLTDEDVNNAPGRPDPPFPLNAIKEPSMLNRGGIEGKLVPMQPLYFEYLQLLNHPCSRVGPDEFNECLASRGSSELTLDASPDYSYDFLAPFYLKQLSPLSKIVMMIREPVERAEVLYRHYKLTQWLYPGAASRTCAPALYHSFDLPLPLANRTAWGLSNAQGKWLDKGIDVLARGFLEAVQGDREALATLQRALNCPPADVACQADNWRDISTQPLMQPMEHRLFMGGLYRYMMAMWRRVYFQPGRVMLIDSQAYYERRYPVMEKVIRYLYGRPMLKEEREIAASGLVWRKAGVPPLSGVKLSKDVGQQLAEFYNQHVMQGFFRMLTDMSAEGAWVAGFDSEPWDQCPGFAEFNRDRTRRH
ncbi:hypothetical protein VOLCADRAFT_104713 [Volvox carteri f. nagariensis]|uniref:Sulfotransferase n=1 Tax=Volvox carteri f. nagariensis TaxID=3068 RepID=D8TV80_VOLCA|nr:uncharacterized protein VOLCADRAFT_104713 [Volvox carteri f. nagariensis]EFJ48530.1 hypothetical protein VOLCADRAFT_104713 [Volvox carteri f. nagariensis]|eukprot:XP_002950329.1 hypothetical protein VOLCADRAFT_104713 [Volvox carteri f. nagariensis]